MEKAACVAVCPVVWEHADTPHRGHMMHSRWQWYGFLVGLALMALLSFWRRGGYGQDTVGGAPLRPTCAQRLQEMSDMHVQHTSSMVARGSNVPAHYENHIHLLKPETENLT